MTGAEPRVRQQPEDVHVGRVFVVAAVALAIGGIALFVAWSLTPTAAIGVARPAPTGSIAGVDRDPIETSSRGLSRAREARARLERWEWVDRERGLARIPIEHAMDLVVRGERPIDAPREAP